MEIEIKEFLRVLSDFGREEGYFEELPIGDLEKSCCQKSTVSVIDFDKTKDKIIRNFKHQALKSVDGLKFPLFERIDFIELKGFKKFLERQLDCSGQVKNQVKKKVRGFNLAAKIMESIHLLKTLVYSSEFERFNRSRTGGGSAKLRGMLGRIPKRFIVVIDIDAGAHPLENLAATLDFLSAGSTSIERQIVDMMQSDLENIRGSEYDNLGDPILKSCRSLDTYYAETVEAG